MTFKLCDNLVLPANAATDTYAFLGTRGSGKTYAAGKMIEEFLDGGVQVAVIDLVGVWWGLRLAADGKRPDVQRVRVRKVDADKGRLNFGLAFETVKQLPATDVRGLLGDGRCLDCERPHGEPHAADCPFAKDNPGLLVGEVYVGEFPIARTE